MSPRGVAHHDVRGRLLDAAEALLLDGPASSVTIRAVTHRAGVATGLLYRYFDDLDDLLGELVLDRVAADTALADDLRHRIGVGDVVDTVVRFGERLLAHHATRLGRILLDRPAVVERVRREFEAGRPGIVTFEHALRRYLRAEQNAGRINPRADTAGVAALLVSSWHQTAMSGSGPSPRRTVRAVWAGLAPHDDRDG